mgnify:FL=1
MSTDRLEASLASLRAEKALMAQRLAAVEEGLAHEKDGDARDRRVMPNRFKQTNLRIR